jgi:hypothetical protein
LRCVGSQVVVSLTGMVGIRGEHELGQGSVAKAAPWLRLDRGATPFSSSALPLHLRQQKDKSARSDHFSHGQDDLLCRLLLAPTV